MQVLTLNFVFIYLLLVICNMVLLLTTSSLARTVVLLSDCGFSLSYDCKFSARVTGLSIVYLVDVHLHQGSTIWRPQMIVLTE